MFEKSKNISFKAKTDNRQRLKIDNTTVVREVLLLVVSTG